MSASGPVRDGPSGQERMEELFGSVFDLAAKIAPRVSPNEVEARLRRALQESGRHPGGMPAEPIARRFRTVEVPPLAGGYTDRPDTAHGIVATLVPGSTVALVPAQAAAEGPSNWLGACGKTQIALIIAESLWRSGAIDALIWIAATNRASVLSAYMQASAAATGIEPTGTAESVAARFISWLSTTSQPWLVVLDDLLETADLDGLWPEGPDHAGECPRSSGWPLAADASAAESSATPPPRPDITDVIYTSAFTTRRKLRLFRSAYPAAAMLHRCRHAWGAGPRRGGAAAGRRLIIGYRRAPSREADSGSCRRRRSFRVGRPRNPGVRSAIASGCSRGRSGRRPASGGAAQQRTPHLPRQLARLAPRRQS